MPPPQDDRTLLAAACRGDASALERIYRMHKDVMFTAAVCLLGGDRAAAEDVLHDVFVTLAERSRSLALTGSLRNYLLTSCLNRARDHLRQQTRSITATLQVRPADDDFINPHDAATRSEESTMLQKALATLPAEQREAVVLHVHGQMTFREIAETLGISSNTAKSRYRYALSALRSMLAEKFIEDGGTTKE